jgi:hypothetical protein
MDQPLTADLFLPHVGKVFRVKDGRHQLTLSQVDVRRVADSEAKLFTRQPFTLIFGGPPGDVLRQGLYTFEVEGGPAVELYVIPVQTFARDRQDYQAVFN